MSGVASTIGKIGSLASPLIGMLPGGSFLNAGISGLNALTNRTQGGSGMVPYGGLAVNYGGGFAPSSANSAQPQSGWQQFLGGLSSLIPSMSSLGKGAGMLGAGALGGYLLNRSGALDPQVVDDPRNQMTNYFANMLRNGGNIGQTLGQQGMLPGFQGPWSAGMNDAQNAAMGGMSNIFNQFMGGGQQQGQDILSQLSGAAGQMGQLNLPPELQQALGASGQGNRFLEMLSGGAIQDPYMQAMAQSGMGQPMGLDQIGGAGQWLGQQMGNGTIERLLQGGQTADIGGIAAALDAARRPGLDRDIRDLRENFSFNGLRRGSNIGNAVAARQAESESGMMGELARIMPQLTGQSSQTSLGTLNAISNLAQTQGQLGQMAGQLGLGQGSLLQSGLRGAGDMFGQGIGRQMEASQMLNQGGLGQLGALGNIFNQQQGNSLQALLAQPGAFSQLSQLPGQMANQLYGMGTTQQQFGQQGIQNQLQGFQQQQALIPLLMQFMSGTPQQQVTPSWLSQLGQLGLGAAAVRQGK